MKSTIRCILWKLTSERTDPEQIKRDGWHEQRILVVSADDQRLNWLEREQVNQLGEKLYGQHGRT